jgi:hypothetical protein
VKILFIIFALWLPVMGWARTISPTASLPDRAMTPGAINPAVTPGTIDQTICVRGWTKSVRPGVRYTERLKKSQIRAYGYADTRPWRYEEDHLIPLDLGGSPDSPLNLWPEPHFGAGEWGSYAKDRLEARMVRLVCRHQLSLDKARAMMAGDWVAAYRRYLGPQPDNSRPERRYRVYHGGYWHHHGW